MVDGQGVRRWVVTHIGRDGLRTLTHTAQGRETFATREEAQAWIDAAKENTPSQLASVVGDVSTLRPIEIECWPAHLDPKGTVFDPARHCAHGFEGACAECDGREDLEPLDDFGIPCRVSKRAAHRPDPARGRETLLRRALQHLEEKASSLLDTIGDSDLFGDEPQALADAVADAQSALKATGRVPTDAERGAQEAQQPVTVTSPPATLDQVVRIAALAVRSSHPNVHATLLDVATEIAARETEGGAS